MSFNQVVCCLVLVVVALVACFVMLSLRVNRVIDANLANEIDSALGRNRGLKEWASEVSRVANEKGFRSAIADPQSIDAIAIYVANFHGEASELWEAARRGDLFKPCDKAAKMRALGLRALGCAEEELADMLIRTLDIADVLGLDIEDAVRIKHAFNKTRPFMHGKKA